MVFLIAGTVWLLSYFQQPIQVVWHNLYASVFETLPLSGSSSVSDPKGVPRTTSYGGKLQEAERLMDNEYYSLASVALFNAIKEKPNIIQPYLLLGEIYLRTKEFDKLDGLIAQIKQVFPERNEGFVLEVRKLIVQEKFEEATQMFQSFSGILPPELKFYQAVFLALQNNQNQTKKILEELNGYTVEKNEMLLSSTGTVAQDSNTVLTSPFSQRVTDMLLAYKNFDVLKEGKNAHLFILLGKALAQNNEAILAHNFADLAIKEDVSYIDAWILRGYTSFLLKDYPSAIEDLRHAHDMDSNRPQTNYFLGLALSQSGNTEEAIVFFEKILEHPFELSEDVKWKLVDLYAQTKKYEKILLLYKDLLNENTKLDQATSALHLLIDIISRPEIALDFTTKRYEKNPDDIFTLNIHGWALIANKKFDDAEKVLDHAKDLNPQNPQTLLNLGLLYESQGEIQKALDFYKQSYEFGKEGNADAIVNLAAQKYNILLEKKGSVLFTSPSVASDVPKSSP